MQNILEFLKMLFNLLWMTIKNLWYVHDFLDDLVVGLSAAFAYLPDFLIPFMIVSLALTVLLGIWRLFF